LLDAGFLPQKKFNPTRPTGHRYLTNGNVALIAITTALKYLRSDSKQLGRCFFQRKSSSRK
jgi:hypothetical protein